MFGLDTLSLLLVVGGVLLLFLLLDLLVAGGGMTCGMMSSVGSMMGGASGMIGTPWGWALLLAVAALIAFQFFSPLLGR